MSAEARALLERLRQWDALQMPVEAPYDDAPYWLAEIERVLTEPVAGSVQEQAEAFDHEYAHSVIAHALGRTRSGTKHEAFRALDELAARVRVLEGARDALAAALRKECGSAARFRSVYAAALAASSERESDA